MLKPKFWKHLLKSFLSFALAASIIGTGATAIIDREYKDFINDVAVMRQSTLTDTSSVGY